MDADDFRSVVEREGADVWSFIEAAISVAATDHPDELRLRRDKIVEALYASPPCPTCWRTDVPSATTTSTRGMIEDYEEEVEEEGDGSDPYAGLFDDEQTTILKIKQQLDDSDRSEDLVDLLQSLADMDITFAALKETDIGRHVNGLRKHPSSDVRMLVKLLVRKWIDIVDDWVKVNPQGDHSASGLMADGDSPQQKITHNDHLQVPDFGCSPNQHYGSSGSDKNSGEPERRKARIIRPKKAPKKPTQRLVSTSAPSHSNAQQRQRDQPRETNVDVDAKLASARKRLQANYKEAANAKKQRTIQVMDIHELPKPKAKNAFFAKNKGGGGSHGRHW